MEIQSLDNNEFLSLLERKKKVKYNKGTYACVTYLLRANTNIRDEINAMLKGKGNKWAPQKNIQQDNADKIVTFLRAEEYTSFPTGLLILVDNGDIEAFELPYKLDMSISPNFDYKFHLDPVIEELEKWKDREIEKENDLFIKEFNSDMREKENYKKDLIPGINEVKKYLEKKANNISRIYITESFKNKKDSKIVLEKINKFNIELIKLGGKVRPANIINGYGGIIAFTYYHEEKVIGEIQEEKYFVTNNPRLYFEYNDKSIIEGFEVVEPVETFIRTEMKSTSSSSIYYVVARRGDGKSQALQYIIRHYMKKLNDHHFLPVFCPIRPKVDNNNNIIDFWYYLKSGLKKVYGSIQKDEELLGYLKLNKRAHDVLKSMDAELEKVRQDKGWSDEETVRKIIKKLTEEKIFKKIILFIDELDKPEFKPIVYNFFNENQNLFADLFKNGCIFFICSTPDWFNHITKDSNLNFYSGTTIYIPELIRPDQCRSMIERRYGARNLELPIKIPDEGFRYIMEASEGIRRTIIENWVHLIHYCESNDSDYLSLEEIQSILMPIPPNIKTNISDTIRSSNSLLEIFMRIYETGDSYLDAIEFVFTFGDKYPLKKIELSDKQIEIKRILEAHGFEQDEFADCWDWMKKSDIVDGKGRINNKLSIFISEFLNILNDGNKYAETELLFTPKNLLETVNKLNNNWSITRPLFESKINVGKIKSDKEKKDKKKERKEDFIDFKEEKPIEKVKTMPRISFDLDDWERSLNNKMRVHLNGPLLPDEIFKNIEGDARSEIHSRLKTIFKKYNLGNLTFTEGGLLEFFSPLGEGEERLIKDFMNPPFYVSGNPEIYYGIVLSFLKILKKAELNLDISIKDIIEDWIETSMTISQFDTIKSKFKNSGLVVQLLDLIKSQGRKRSCYISFEEVKEEKSLSSIDELVRNRLLFKGVVYKCKLCGVEIVSPYLKENKNPVIHSNCRGSCSMGSFDKLEERSEVYYLDPKTEKLLFLLRFVYGSKILTKNPVIHFKPTLKGSFVDVDLLIIINNRILVGVKVVSKISEINNITKNKPNIFSDFWYIPTKQLGKKNESKYTLVPIMANMKKWINDKVRSLKPQDTKIINKFQSKL